MQTTAGRKKRKEGKWLMIIVYFIILFRPSKSTFYFIEPLELLSTRQRANGQKIKTSRKKKWPILELLTKLRWPRQQPPRRRCLLLPLPLLSANSRSSSKRRGMVALAAVVSRPLARPPWFLEIMQQRQKALMYAFVFTPKPALMCLKDVFSFYSNRRKFDILSNLGGLEKC